MRTEIKLNPETLGSEILKAARLNAEAKNLIRESKNLFKEFKRLEGMNPDPELFKNYKVTNLGILERKFENFPQSHRTAEEFYMYKLKVSRVLTELIGG